MASAEKGVSMIVARQLLQNVLDLFGGRPGTPPTCTVLLPSCSFRNSFTLGVRAAILAWSSVVTPAIIRPVFRAGGQGEVVPVGEEFETIGHAALERRNLRARGSWK